MPPICALPFWHSTHRHTTTNNVFHRIVYWMQRHTTTNIDMETLTYKLDIHRNFDHQEYSKEAVAHVQKYLMKNEVPVNLFEVGVYICTIWYWFMVGRLQSYRRQNEQQQNVLAHTNWLIEKMIKALGKIQLADRGSMELSFSLSVIFPVLCLLRSPLSIVLSFYLLFFLLSSLFTFVWFHCISIFGFSRLHGTSVKWKFYCMTERERVL